MQFYISKVALVFGTMYLIILVVLIIEQIGFHKENENCVQYRSDYRLGLWDGSSLSMFFLSLIFKFSTFH